jgi:hypothetical protein
MKRLFPWIMIAPAVLSVPAAVRAAAPTAAPVAPPATVPVAPPATVQVAPPAAPPATAPAQTFALSESTVPAGIAVHVDASAMYAPSAAAFDRCLSWNFGDSTPVADPTNYATGAIADVGYAWPGRFAAHRYLTPGVYTITLSERLRNDNGSAGALLRSISQPVTVTPAGRSVVYVDGGRGNDSNPGINVALPLKTVDRALSVTCGKSNIEIQLSPGQVYPVAGSITFLSKGQHNFVMGVPFQHGTATLYHAGSNDFIADGGKETDKTFQGITFDSATTPAGKNIGGLPGCVAGVACVGIIRGTNTCFADCNLGHLNQGFHTAGSTVGCYYLRCAQLQPLGITSNVAWMTGRQIAFAGCTFSGSNWEPAVRGDGDGPGSTGLSDSSIVYCRLGQVRNPQGLGNGKEGLTIRLGSGIDVYNNLCVDALLHLNGPGTTQAGEQAATVSRADVRHNCIVGANTSASLEIQPGVTQSAVQDNLSIQSGKGPCYQLIATAAGTPATRDLLWRNNRALTLTPGGVGLNASAPLPVGFVCDIVLPAAQIAGAAAGLTTSADVITTLPATMPTR